MTNLILAQTNDGKSEDKPETKPSILLIEERLNIELKAVAAAKVSIHTKTVSEEVSKQVPVFYEEVVVEHIPMGTYVDAAPEPRQNGDTMIISVVKEVLVVEKKLLLVEELHISKKQFETELTVTETLRKQEVEVSREELA